MNDEREEALQQSKEHAPAEHWHAQTGGKGHYTGHFLATSALAFAGCLWGTGFLFGKIAFREMTVSENVAFRFVCGSIALVPVLLRKSIPIRGNNLWLLLLASIIGVPLQFLVQFTGLRLTTVSHASLIVGTLPVLLALSSALFLHERLDGLEWAILLASGAGAVLIALSKTNVAQGPGPRPSLMGDVLVLISMVAAVVMILITKRLMENYGSLQVTASTITIGTIWLVLGAELYRPLRFRFSIETLGSGRRPRTTCNLWRVSALELGLSASAGLTRWRVSQPGAAGRHVAWSARAARRPRAGGDCRRPLDYGLCSLFQ